MNHMTAPSLTVTCYNVAVQSGKNISCKAFTLQATGKLAQQNSDLLKLIIYIFKIKTVYYTSIYENYL